MLNLRQQEDPDTQYVMDMVKMGSPSRDDNVHRQHSRRTLKTVKQTPVLHNNVRGEDPQFDQCWEDTIHGRATNDNMGDEHEQQHTHANIQVNNTSSAAGMSAQQPGFVQSQIKTSVWNNNRQHSRSSERAQQQ